MRDFVRNKPFSTLLTVFCAAGLTGTACAADALPLPATPAAWVAAVTKDINDTYQETLENHPGTYDPKNPDFRKNLTIARDRALAMASQVKDAAGYEAVFSRFNVTLHDGHAGAFAILPASAKPPIRWPGFITVWRDGGLYVYAAETGQPEKATQVLSCDGKAIKDLIRDNVFSFGGRIDEAGHWWVYGRQVLIDYGNPFIQPPKQCELRTKGKTYTHTLDWQAVNEHFNTWRKISYNGDSLPAGMTEPRPKLLWVAMPSFQLDAAEQDSFNTMTKEISEHRERALKADAIVIDLRQNQGGSSEWSNNFAAALWGKGRVARQMNAYSPNSEVWWRASKDNTRYMQKMAEDFISEKSTENAAWAKQQADGMQAALAKGEHFYVETTSAGAQDTAKPADDLPGDPVRLKTPVYVIVPGQCASACLDALDVFTRFPNTKLIGAPSAADSTYMEGRVKSLPSGMAKVIIPNKVYANRARAAGQVYFPAIPVRDIEWSVDNFLQVVERDLATTR